MTEVKRENAVKIEGRQYVVVAPDSETKWAVGTILTLTDDDGTNLPWFTDIEGNEYLAYMHEVMLLAETGEKHGDTDGMVMPKHKYSVGQKLTVNSNGSEYYHCFDENEVVTVEKLGGLSGMFRGTVPMYRVKAVSNGKEQTLLETQLEQVAPHITEEQYAAIEVGDTIVIREDLEIGRYGENSVNTEMLQKKGKQLTVKNSVGNAWGVRVEEAFYSWTQQMIAEVIKKEEVKQAHKYAVGDRVKLVSSSPIIPTVPMKSVGVIDRVETENTMGQVEYYVNFDTAGNFLLEGQIELVSEKSEFIPEEGQIYFADQTGNYSHNWIIKAGKIKDDAVGMGFALRTDNASYNNWGELPFSDVTTWTPATDEQKIKLITAMAEHGDATDSDLELLSELMPTDNPELEVGEVYSLFGREEQWLFRKDIKNEEGKLWHCAALSPCDSWFSTEGYFPMYDYRKALPHEVAKLEAAEKGHGCEYKKPLINSKGTVIEVGKYYTEKEMDKDVKSVALITSIDHDRRSFTEHFINLHQQYFMNDVNMTRNVNDDYAQHLVPATPEEIAEFKAAENRSSISKGQKYILEGIAGNKQEIEVINVTDNGTVQFKYRSVFDNTVCAGLSVDSHYWKTAELLN